MEAIPDTASQVAAWKAVITQRSFLRAGQSTPSLTCYALLVVAGLMHLPHEELQANDGVDDDDEQH